MGKGGRVSELPVDRGWSWVICFASFVIMLLLGTAPQAIAVLFLELVTQFESSITVTSLSVMLYIMSISISSLVSTNFLVPRYGERAVIVGSSLVFAACSIGYHLSPNIAVFIAFATVKGIAVGFIFVPAVSLHGFYFSKRRSLAITISNCGICVATIIAPPFVRALAYEFGMKGTFLILAGIELNMAAAGLLMRPVACYKVMPRETTGLTDVAESEDEAAKDSFPLKPTEHPKSDGHADNDISDAEHKLLSSCEKSDHPVNGAKIITASPLEPSSLKENGRFYDRMDSHVSEIIVDPPESQSYSEKDGVLAYARQESRQRAASFGRQHSRTSHHGSDDWSTEYRRPSRAAHRGSLMSVTSSVEPANVGMGMQPVEEDEDMDEEDEGQEKKSGWKSCCFVRVLLRIFDPKLLNLWAFRVFLLAAIPSATTQYLFQYLPTIAEVKGVTKDEAATLQTIVGAVDLASRLALGIFADTHILRPTQIAAFCQICLGILCQFNPLFIDFESLLVMAVIMGLFIGTRQSLMAVMQIEIVGVERMARCLSITAMVATISAASHSPLLSAVMEATGSYNVVLHYLGVALILGGVLIGSTSLLARIDARRVKEKEKSPS